MTYTRPSMIDLPRIEDLRGNLSVIEELDQIPFEIARVHWIYDVPGGQIRGGHAFRKQQEVIVALSGSFDVIIGQGSEEEVFSLNRSYYGLFVPPLFWRQMRNFSTNALAMVLSSTEFSEDDYIRDFRELSQQIKS